MNDPQQALKHRLSTPSDVHKNQHGSSAPSPTQVTELRLRLYQLDSILPLLARSYEVAVVAGQLDQSQGLWQWQWSGGAAPHANASSSGSGSSGAPVMVRGPGGGDAGEEGGGRGGSERSSANEPALVFAAGRGGSAGTAREVALKLGERELQLGMGPTLTCIIL